LTVANLGLKVLASGISFVSAGGKEATDTTVRRVADDRIANLMIW
jgi:hypothetical protein